MNDKTIVLDVVKDTTTGEKKVIYPNARIYTEGQNIPKASSDENTLGLLPREDVSGWRWANWGTNDCLPTEIRTKIMQSPMASSAVYKLTKMMYGNGLAYYRNEDLRNGDGKVKRHYSPTIEAFMKRNKLGLKWLVPQMADYRFYMNGWSEMILNKFRNQITGIYHKPAEFCRLSKQDEKSLAINWLYYSPYFGQYAPSDDRIKKIPLLRWWDAEEQIKKQDREFKFAWHSRFETPGIKYYARPYWLGLFRKDGWLDASISVPEIVNAMMRNQVILTYQILIPESYFQITNQDWHTYTDDEREKKIDELITHINKELSDTDNLYKSIASVYKQSEMNGQAEGKIEIVSIDDKVKKDSWIPTSDVADAQVVQGFGLHPSQMGLGTKNGGMGAGSGSDQREGFNTEITLNTIDQSVVLEPLQFVADFNARTNPEWDVTFFIDHTFHTTTNNQESGLQPSDTTLTIE